MSAASGQNRRPSASGPRCRRDRAIRAAIASPSSTGAPIHPAIPHISGTLRRPARSLATTGLEGLIPLAAPHSLADELLPTGSLVEAISWLVVLQHRQMHPSEPVLPGQDLGGVHQTTPHALSLYTRVHRNREDRIFLLATFRCGNLLGAGSRTLSGA